MKRKFTQYDLSGLAKYTSHQKGISILECLLAIVLVFGIAAGMIGYFKSASRTQRITDGLALTSDLLQVAAQYWQSNLTFSPGNVTPLNDEIAIQSGLLPVVYTKLASNDNTIATPWTEIATNSRVTISGTGSTVTITFSNLPNEACQPFGEQLKIAGYHVELDCGDLRSNENTSTVTLTNTLDF